MREIRRRTRVVGAFPDGNAAVLLVAARLRHIAGTRWGVARIGRRPAGVRWVIANEHEQIDSAYLVVQNLTLIKIFFSIEQNI